MSTASRLLPSPCIGICQIDQTTGWCIGCGRNGDELTGWGDLPVSAQEAVWAQLPARLRQLQQPMRVLPWNAGALLERLAVLTFLPGTVWSIGVVGASAELLATRDAELAVAVGGNELIARHPNGRLRVRSVAGLRGFVQRGAEGAEIALAVHVSRLKETMPEVVTDLGPDRNALHESGRTERLVDLGLGCADGIRFCVRTGDPALEAALRAAVGKPLFATDLPARLMETSPTRVLTSPVARIEVTAPIAQPGGQTPEGPHTHLLAQRLRTGSARRRLGTVPEGYAIAAQVFATTTALAQAEIELDA